MKKIALALAFLTMALTSTPAPLPQVEQQLVAAMRFVNTYEYSFFHDNKRFASVDEFLNWLQGTGKIGESPMNLSAESLKPYELRITASSDGKHYQAGMIPLPDTSDNSTACKPAAFTNDRGIIYLGLALGCAAPGKPSAHY
jgi:hypothetical protein